MVIPLVILAVLSVVGGYVECRDRWAEIISSTNFWDRYFTQRSEQCAARDRR